MTSSRTARTERATEGREMEGREECVEGKVKGRNGGGNMGREGRVKGRKRRGREERGREGHLGRERKGEGKDGREETV